VVLIFLDTYIIFMILQKGKVEFLGWGDIEEFATLRLKRNAHFEAERQKLFSLAFDEGGLYGSGYHCLKFV